MDGTTFDLRTLPEWHPAAAMAAAPWVFLKAKYLGTEQGAIILRHEAQHIRDQRAWSVLWWLSYLLLLPVGPSFKALWEWRAYKITLRAERERTGSISSWTQDHVARSLAGPLYLWAMPRWLADRLVAGEVKRLAAEQGGR